jgi:hypothetical protein
MIVHPYRGWSVTLYACDSAPVVYDIVWCAWPIRQKRGAPGVVRGVLVLDSRPMTDDDGTEWMAITVAYGTGAENIARPGPDCLIIPEAEYRALNLHKPTIFQLDFGNRHRLAWGDKYFPPPRYVINRGIKAGSLNEDQKKRFHKCFTDCGFTFPLPR